MQFSLGTLLLFAAPLIAACTLSVLLLRVRWKYVPRILDIFQTTPLFVVPRGQPPEGAEAVRFPSLDGRMLNGCYFKCQGRRRGVILFGLEFGSNCWSSHAYCTLLLESGYDVFAFEPRSQGDSEKEPGYEPLHWVTDFEVTDTKAAIAYLKGRPDADPFGIGFFGISKGAGAGLIAGADDPYVLCFATDGVFGTLTTVVPYMKRFFRVYNKAFPKELLEERFLAALYHYAAWRVGRVRGCAYPSLEQAMPRLAPRGLMMIHGEADGYIKPEMARSLLARAGGPKELWVVEGAGHNQALHVAGEEYSRRVLAFFDRHLGGEGSAGAARPGPALGAHPGVRLMFRHFVWPVIKFLLNHVVLKVVAGPIRRNLTVFEAACLDPRRVQEAVLLGILKHQQETAFGRDHAFASLKSAADFGRVIPVRGYEAIEPYIERVKKGETRALLNDPCVHMFAMTSGTTASRKFIPVTDRYLEDYRRSWNVWGLKVFMDHPDVKLRPIVQMAGDSDEMRTEAGIPCGAVTGLTARMQKWIVRLFYCVPAALARVKDPQAKYYAVLRASMPRDVGMVIAANPSTMLALARAGDAHKESLIRDIHDGTLTGGFDYTPEVRGAMRGKVSADRAAAKRLEQIAGREGHLYPKDYWANKFILGNWTGGSVGAYLHNYPKYFGDNYVRDVGLIASEGRMTIPMEDGTSSGPLDITSHYFEFIPEGEADSPNPTVLGAHELQEGGRYFILLTTAYGLYRYNIHDVVRVTGFRGKTPLVEFLSKGANFANMTGEKLSEYHVTQSVAGVLRDMGASLGTYSVAPCWPDDDAHPPWYSLFVEPADAHLGEALAGRLEKKLCEANIEYEAKRGSQRLGPLRLKVVPAGFWARWDASRLARTGGTLEQYKHPCLIADLAFHKQAGA